MKVLDPILLRCLPRDALTIAVSFWFWTLGLELGLIVSCSKGLCGNRFQWPQHFCSLFLAGPTSHAKAASEVSYGLSCELPGLHLYFFFLLKSLPQVGVVLTLISSCSHQQQIWLWSQDGNKAVLGFSSLLMQNTWGAAVQLPSANKCPCSCAVVLGWSGN